MPARNLTAEDLPAVEAVQRACYPAGLREAVRTFRCKIAAFPEGCLGLERDGRLGGYVFCQPWTLGLPLPLEDDGRAAFGKADCLYIHDLSVIPGWRGTGAARTLLAEVFGLAADRGFAALALVAVQGSEGFWSHWGFRPAHGFLYAPGIPATYMVLGGADRPGAVPSGMCTPGPPNAMG
jgi:GNAT superfamily N-acetyltransferase